MATNYMQVGGPMGWNIPVQEGSQAEAQIKDINSRPDRGFLGSVGGFLFGESPDAMQQRRIKELQKQFGLGGPAQLSDFQLGGLGAQSNQLGGLSEQLGNRQLLSGYSPFRQHQMGLLNQAQQDIAGQGPMSQLARQVAGDFAGQGYQQQAAQLAGQRSNPLAVRSAAFASGNIAGQAGQQAQRGVLQAQQAGFQAASGLANQGRQGDLQYGSLGLQAQGLNDRARFAALQQQLARQQMQQQGMQALQANTLARGNMFMGGTAPGVTSSQQMLGFGMGVGEMLAGNPMGVQRMANSAQGGGGSPMSNFANGMNSPGSAVQAGSAGVMSGVAPPLSNYQYQGYDPFQS